VTFSRKIGAHASDSNDLPERKLEIHPENSKVWVCVYDRVNLYSGDFFDENDRLLLTVDIPKHVVSNSNYAKSFELLATFYDHSIMRSPENWRESDRDPPPKR